jgi:hypothetical protein
VGCWQHRRCAGGDAVGSDLRSVLRLIVQCTHLKLARLGPGIPLLDHMRKFVREEAAAV